MGWVQVQLVALSVREVKVYHVKRFKYAFFLVKSCTNEGSRHALHVLWVGAVKEH
jgi:hypothetical protein